MNLTQEEKELLRINKEMFHTALLKLQTEIEAMTKDESNPFFKSKYVPLDKMLTILKPILSKRGFILSQPVDVANTQQGMRNVVFSRLVHVPTGLSEEAKLMLPDIQDMQKLGGAITYARRYTLSPLLALIEKDDDGNFASDKIEVKKGTKSKDIF